MICFDNINHTIQSCGSGDALKLVGDMGSPKSPGRHDYQSPTFLNGYFGNKL